MKPYLLCLAPDVCPTLAGSRQTPIHLYPPFPCEPPDAGLESSQAEKHHGAYRLGIQMCRSLETAPNEVSALAGGDPEGGTRNGNELTRFDGYAGPLGVVTRGRGEREIADFSAASCRRALLSRPVRQWPDLAEIRARPIRSLPSAGLTPS